MLIIQSEKDTGKTTELIKLSSLHGFPIITENIDSRRYILKKAMELNLTIPQPIMFNMLLNNELWRKGYNGILIDDAELLLNKICRGKLKVLTITGPKNLIAFDMEGIK